MRQALKLFIQALRGDKMIVFNFSTGITDATPGAVNNTNISIIHYGTGEVLKDEVKMMELGNEIDEILRK